MGILFYFFMAFSGAFFSGVFEHIDLHSFVAMGAYSDLTKIVKV